MVKFDDSNTYCHARVTNIRQIKRLVLLRLCDEFGVPKDADPQSDIWKELDSILTREMQVSNCVTSFTTTRRAHVSHELTCNAASFVVVEVAIAAHASIAANCLYTAEVRWLPHFKKCASPADWEDTNISQRIRCFSSCMCFDFHTVCAKLYISQLPHLRVLSV